MFLLQVHEFINFWERTPSRKTSVKSEFTLLTELTFVIKGSSINTPNSIIINFSVKYLSKKIWLQLNTELTIFRS